MLRTWAGISTGTCAGISTACFCNNPDWSLADYCEDYMKGMPKGFIDLADISLAVEGVHLPAHRAILAASSEVFADLLFLPSDEDTAATSATKQELPLTGESLSTVRLVLTYMYRSSVLTPESYPSPDLPHAEQLIRFAHIYGMASVLSAYEARLVPQVLSTRNFNGDFAMMKDNEALAHWIEIAEQCEMHQLLAHCESFLSQDDDEILWKPETIVADSISRESLLRVVRAMQLHVKALRRLLPAHSPSCAVGAAQLMEWRPSNASKKTCKNSLADVLARRQKRAKELSY